MKRILGFLILVIMCCFNLTADLSDALIAYYPFNGNANDESGNGNNGIVNGATLTTDRLGNANSAFYFAGDNAYNSPHINANINFNQNQDCFSLSFWVCRIGDGFINPRVLEFYDSGEGADWSISWANNGNLEYVDTELENNIWYNVTITYGGGTMLTSFLNGQYEGTFDIHWASSDTTLPLSNEVAFGRMNHPAWDAFNGIIDDIYIYERVLDFSEIQELYYHFKSNFTSPEAAYVGNQIQFTDTSTGNPTTWEWDFENDGIYDSTYYSYQDIIYWTYEDTNVDSVKLKISNDTYVDSLTKAITVEYCPPASPQNVNVEIIQPDAMISWAEVDTTDCGSTIIPDGYIIRYNETATEFDEDFYFLNFTTQTNYVHTFVAQYSPQMFYRVVAIKNYSREQIEYLENFNNSHYKLKWSEVKRNLEAKK
jgi:PKD repeat protein